MRKFSPANMFRVTLNITDVSKKCLLSSIHMGKPFIQVTIGR